MNEKRCAKGRIECIRADITRENVDAIVNAANNELAGGGGVDGAIHRAAGEQLLEATRRLYPRGCPTGEVRVTPGFNLPAVFVFHTVGPVYHGPDAVTAEALANCHRNAIRIANMLRLRSIAFPAISCGIYGYPHEEAARVAMAAATEALAAADSIELVRFCLFGDDLQGIFEAARRDLCA